METLSDRRIIPMSLPRSFGALFKAFNRPASIACTPNETASRYLTRSFLQNDENCSESSDLVQILGTIFAFSDRYPWNEALPLELDAGVRYWLPNGDLAQEWVRFWSIAPDRYLSLAPPDVQEAYLAACDSDDDTASMAECVRYDNYVAKTQWEAPNLQQSIDDRKLTGLVCVAQADAGVVDVAVTSHASTGSRKRKFTTDEADIGEVQDAPSHPPDPKRTRREPVPSTLLPAQHIPLSQPTTAALQIRLQAQAQHIIEAPNTPGASQAHSTPLHAKFQPSAAPLVDSQAQPQQIQSRNRMPVTAPDQAQPTPRAPSGPTQRGRGPAPVPGHGQGHVAPNATPAPGSVTHTGRGNVLKAWNSDRIRAFTDIQGHPITNLPKTARSKYSDELSRNHTPKSVDPRLCPFDTTIEECLTYLTLTATTNRELCSRVKVDWTGQQIVQYVYYAHDLTDSSTYDRTRLQKQFKACADGLEARSPNHMPTASMTNLSTENGLTGGDKHTHDFYLHAMGKNVVRHPAGRAAQMLTRVIRHVVEVTGDRNVRLSQAAQYARDHGIVVPDAELMDSNLDVADVPDTTVMASARADYYRKFGRYP